MKRNPVDIHTHQAIKVAKADYYLINRESGNEVAGLLIGTAVKKYTEPECVQSKYHNGLYWSRLIEAPNGEIRRIGCDALTPKKTDKFFKAQKRMFGYKFN